MEGSGAIEETVGDEIQVRRDCRRKEFDTAQETYMGVNI